MWQGTFLRAHEQPQQPKLQPRSRCMIHHAPCHKQPNRHVQLFPCASVLGTGNGADGYTLLCKVQASPPVQHNEGGPNNPTCFCVRYRQVGYDVLREYTGLEPVLTSLSSSLPGALLTGSEAPSRWFSIWLHDVVKLRWSKVKV